MAISTATRRSCRPRPQRLPGGRHPHRTHETTTAAEAREKLAKGMTILIREGSVSKDLHALAKLFHLKHQPSWPFAPTTATRSDIAEEGHLDFIIRTPSPWARRRSPSTAPRRSPPPMPLAEGSRRDRAGATPDVVLIDSLDHCGVQKVFSAGPPGRRCSFLPAVARCNRGLGS